MGEEGYSYNQILAHYYPGSHIKKCMNNPKKRSPWWWVPSLYFAEGLPNVAVVSVAVVMYTKLGLSNTELAFYTSWLYLPWVIKPLWSPFVDLIGSNRRWILAMQLLIGAAFAGIAFSLPTPYYIQLSFAFFWLVAFSSATHDIAADGFYLLALEPGEQSWFVGIRSIFYRLSTIFGQGVLVMCAGWMEEGKLLPRLAGNIPLAWSIAFYLMAAIFIACMLYHKVVLPRPEQDRGRVHISPALLLGDFFRTFASFFKKPHIGLILFFLLTYRLGEAQLVKIATPFLLGAESTGGLNLSTSTLGLLYGTLGVVALLLGGILGGVLVSRHGFKRWVLPMALAINLPDILYVFLATGQTQNILLIGGSIVVEQLGYGFGFTAYMLYLMYVAVATTKPPTTP